MLRRLAAVIVCILIVALPLTSCKEKEPMDVWDEEVSASAGYRRTVLYYVTDDGFMVPIMKLLPWEEGIGRAAVSQLIGTEVNKSAASRMGLNTVLPEGVELHLRINDEGTATLDIANLPELESASEEHSMVTAIACTLLEFLTISSVRFTFDGERLNKLPHGTKVSGEITDASLNVEPGTVNVSAESTYRMTLYFPNSSASLNIPVTRYTTEMPTVESAVKELILGPIHEGLLECFPDETMLLGVDIVDTTATVNVSREFLAVEDSPGTAEAAYEALFLTINELQEITDLRLQVEGDDYEFGSRPVSAPMYPNEFR
ncbi:MAG: Spore germination protein GerM [Firmicutes bacterium ADurb.Bin182]|nr:MAG: Spore germination protein GerM [Firmicutes bacterium ADurb.Bin182]